MKFLIGMAVGLFLSFFLGLMVIDQVEDRVRAEVTNTLHSIGSEAKDRIDSTFTKNDLDTEEGRNRAASEIGSQAKGMFDSAVKGFKSLDKYSVISTRGDFDKAGTRAFFNREFLFNPNANRDAILATEVAEGAYMDGVEYGIQAAVDAM